MSALFRYRRQQLNGLSHRYASRNVMAMLRTWYGNNRWEHQRPQCASRARLHSSCSYRLTDRGKSSPSDPTISMICMSASVGVTLVYHV